VIDNLPIEQYVSEVVPREMPALWPIGGLQAQAVAARTYALRVLKHSRAMGRAYDICATTACQVFGGYAIAKGHTTRVLENPRTNAAVRSTARLVMTYKGMPILAQYSSSTGGYTQSGGVPYLTAHPDPWDNSSPMHTWAVTISPAAIQKNWPAVGAFRGIAVVARDGRGDFGGRALRVRISGTRRAISVAAAEIMSVFDLPSDWFQFRASPTPRRARPAAHPYRFTRDLSYGMTGSDVRALQLRLRAERMYPVKGPFSDYFGSITLAAVKRYQRAHHIPATGFLGPKTRARLNATK
jgi:stage II sporulation protein D